MKNVWNESLRQAREMLGYWSRCDDGAGIPSMARDTRTLSLNVLAETGFRRSYPFRGSIETNDDSVDTADRYRASLQTVLDNIILVLITPRYLLTLPFSPKSWVKVGEAADEFKQYMVRMMNEETALIKAGQKNTGTLMASFLRALDTNEKAEATASSKPAASQQARPKGLTVDEIFGNIFVINFAGHDTTANTLAFSMLLLAANPEVQDWVSEEINEVTKESADDWVYGELYPKLKRCRAVLVRHIPCSAFPEY